jgi:hypothetical protein
MNMEAASQDPDVCVMRAVLHVPRATRVVVILHSVWAPEPQRAGANIMTKQPNDALERLPQLRSRVCGALP